MKLLPKFNIEKEENYQTIIKNFYLKENFFRKYLKKNILVKSCPVCNSNDLQNSFTFHEIINKNTDFITKNEEKVDFIMKKLRKVSYFENFIIFTVFRNEIFVCI